MNPYYAALAFVAYFAAGLVVVRVWNARDPESLRYEPTQNIIAAVLLWPIGLALWLIGIAILGLAGLVRWGTGVKKQTHTPIEGISSNE